MPKKSTLARPPYSGGATGSANRFRYKIVCNGEVIAMFLHLPDRNWSIGVLKDEYPDCRFEERDE
jgi:hypothetical protein